MKSITRVIKFASAVICSCAIATTANAAPETVKELVEKIYIPYTNFEESSQSFQKFKAHIGKFGCRVEEGKYGWEFYQSESDKPCLKKEGVYFVRIKYEQGVANLDLMGSSSSANFDEIKRFKKLDEWQVRGNIQSFYENNGLYYHHMKDNEGFIYLTVSKRNPLAPLSSIDSSATTNNAVKNSSSTIDNASIQKSESISNHSTAIDNSGNSGWVGWVIAIFVLGLIMFFYNRYQAFTAVAKITGKPWIEKTYLVSLGFSLLLSL